MEDNEFSVQDELETAKGKKRKQFKSASIKFKPIIQSDRHTINQSSSTKKKGPNKNHEKPLDVKNKKKHKGKKKKKKSKYNKNITTNVDIDVWVEIRAYVNWIIKVVFHGDDTLVCRRPLNHPNHGW